MAISNNIVVICGVIGNISSVVGIVIMNKYITDVDGFDFMVFLSFLHFLFTYIGLHILLCLGVFKANKAPLSGVMPVALGSLMSVAFMNLNLSYNTVGFYQLSKLACIPFTLFVQYLAYKQSVSKVVQLTLIPITFGVGYATVYDVNVNVIGSIFATVAVVATSLAQIFTNTYQKSLDCNPLQLLYLTSPLITVGMLLLSPFFDDMTALRNYKYTNESILHISISCFFALGVNISNYLVLGMTSPLTYQVLGHLKTVLIIMLGFLIFNKAIDSRNLTGILIAMAGVISYTEITRRQKAAPPLPTTR
mmetsp:Transcript_23359/g.21248  ORF Transcript_23359/g.21248 Transcript_23359/m.21248 type:complete len:306 (+) Transcript_23359:76-993(+)